MERRNKLGFQTGVPERVLSRECVYRRPGWDLYLCCNQHPNDRSTKKYLRGVYTVRIMKKQFKNKVRNRTKLLRKRGLFKRERILDYNVCETMFFGAREKTLTYVFPGKFAFWEKASLLRGKIYPCNPYETFLNDCFRETCSLPVEQLCCSYHLHHIIPVFVLKQMFRKTKNKRYVELLTDSWNLMYLTVENHAKAHWLRFEVYGQKQDLWAARLLQAKFNKQALDKKPKKESSFLGFQEQTSQEQTLTFDPKKKFRKKRRKRRYYYKEKSRPRNGLE
uniref:HNH homing endonuclease n=1 Tax=Chaetophora lobata TaxID=1249516 RepID=A0A7U1AQ01_9CHLO|nr:hypothetical protein [Chaetophora lobata]